MGLKVKGGQPATCMLPPEMFAQVLARQIRDHQHEQR